LNFDFWREAKAFFRWRECHLASCVAGKKKHSNLTHEGQGMHKCQPSLPFRPPILFVLLAGVKPHQI
jgi:hypothetical protein